MDVRTEYGTLFRGSEEIGANNLKFKEVVLGGFSQFREQEVAELEANFVQPSPVSLNTFPHPSFYDEDFAKTPIARVTVNIHKSFQISL